MVESYQLQWARETMSHKPLVTPNTLTSSHSPLSTPSHYHSHHHTLQGHLTTPHTTHSLHTLTTHDTLTHTPHTTHHMHTHTTYNVTFMMKALNVLTDSEPHVKEDEPWDSESEEGDIPDGPQGNLSLGGQCSGGINLREAMALAKIPPIENRKNEVEGQNGPIVEPHPVVGVATSGHNEDDDLVLSDWDDDEEEDVKPRPSLYPLGSTHIPSVVGASREVSALQHERVEGSEGVERGGGEGVEVDVLTFEEDDMITTPPTTVERSKVTGGMTMEFDDESSESESDLPMFGGGRPSAKTVPHSTLPRLPPINQGSPPLQSQRTPSPLSTSPTLVSPLTSAAGMTLMFELQFLYNACLRWV